MQSLRTGRGDAVCRETRLACVQSLRGSGKWLGRERPCKSGAYSAFSLRDNEAPLKGSEQGSNPADSDYVLLLFYYEVGLFFRVCFLNFFLFFLLICNNFNYRRVFVPYSFFK